MDGCSMSMSSVGKVVYESVHRPDETRGGSGDRGGNVLYCPSPYATTRVQLYFPNSDQDVRTTRNDQINDQNCYDMPLLKQASILLIGLRVLLFCSFLFMINIPCLRLI